MLEKVKAPAILVELGYISNESDEKNLSNSDYQDKISLSMTKAIDNYFKMNPQN
ncbi:N-acetylmuramoyl-L-alanine amidase AmiB precursor [compost metagenome]